MIKKDGHAADVYAAVLTYQQNGIHLMDELRRKLSAEVTKITKEEVKGSKRVRACEYYAAAYNLVGTLLLERLERVITPESQEMVLNTPYYGIFVGTSPWPSELGLAITSHITANKQLYEHTIAGQRLSCYSNHL